MHAKSGRSELGRVRPEHAPGSWEPPTPRPRPPRSRCRTPAGLRDHRAPPGTYRLRARAAPAAHPNRRRSRLQLCPTTPQTTRRIASPREPGPRQPRPAACCRPEAVSRSGPRSTVGMHRTGPGSPPTPGRPGPTIPRTLLQTSATSDIGFVDITPTPRFTGLERLDDRMAHRVGVFTGMAHRRRIATADVPAAQAQPKMHPRGVLTQTFFAAVGSSGSDPANSRQVGVEYRRHGCASLVVADSVWSSQLRNAATGAAPDCRPSTCP